MNKAHFIFSNLHQRLLVSCATNRQFFIWMCDGFGHFLPSAFKQRGWKPYIRKTKFNDDRSSLINRSFFGNLQEVDDQNRETSTVIERHLIADEDIYTTQLILPNASRAKLARTIALRLEDLSPLPPEETAFAYNHIGKTEDKRLIIDVAMVRKSILMQLQQVTSGNPDYVEIVSSQFTFKRTINRHKKLKFKTALAPMVFALSLCVFLMGANVFINQQKTALQNFEQKLIAEIKLEKKSQKKLARIREDQNALPSIITASEIISLLQKFETELPDKAFVQNVTIEANTIHAAGYTSNEKTTENSTALTIKTKPSRRPNIVEATFTLKPEASQ